MDKDYLIQAARALESKLPDNHAFILIVAPIGAQDGRLAYVASMQREDAINVLKEFLLKAGAEEDWMRHIK